MLSSQSRSSTLDKDGRPLPPALEQQLQQIQDSDFLTDLRMMDREVEFFPDNADVLEFTRQELLHTRATYEETILAIEKSEFHHLLGHPTRTGGKLAIPNEEDRKLWIDDFLECIKLIDGILPKIGEKMYYVNRRNRR